MLQSVNARVFGRLADAGGSCFHLSFLASTLQGHLYAADNHCGGSTAIEQAVGVKIADNHFRGREDQPLVIADIVAFRHLVGQFRLQLLDIFLTLANVFQFLLYAVLKGRQLLFPIFEYIVHTSGC